MLVTELGVAEDMARIVAGTKTLRHLLPTWSRPWIGPGLERFSVGM
jgi:hypothetical protein